MASALDDIEKLEDNWDNNGAKSFAPELIELCRWIEGVVPFELELFPASNGIKFEFKDILGYIKMVVSSKEKVFISSIDETIGKIECELNIKDAISFINNWFKEREEY